MCIRDRTSPAPSAPAVASLRPPRDAGAVPGMGRTPGRASMKRRLLGIAEVTSLVLCVIAAGVWVRSYWALDSVVHSRVSGTPSWTTVTRWTALWGRGNVTVVREHGEWR